MGIIRKTMSISTLGIVPFRSKKELLRRAEKGQEAAQADLLREQAARAESDRRIVAAERRVRVAELIALHEAKLADKAAGRGRKRRKARKAGKRQIARELLGDVMAAAQPVEDHAREAGRRGRAVAKQAAKAGQKAAERAQAEAEKAAAAARKEAKKGHKRARAKLREVEEAVAPHVEAAAGKAQELADSAKERAAELSDMARERR